MKLNNDIEKDSTIKEFIYFWLFDLKMLPIDNNKQSIIQTLHYFNSKNHKYRRRNLNLSFLNKKLKL